LPKNITTASTFSHPSFFKFLGFWTIQMIPSFPYLLADSLPDNHPLKFEVAYLFLELMPSAKQLAIRTPLDGDPVGQAARTLVRRE
jgi:hypothetical protein